MALYHFHVTQIKRSEGRTAVASAAYRAGKSYTISGMERLMTTPRKVV